MQEGNHNIFNFFENRKNAYFFVKDFLFRGKSGIINRKVVYFLSGFAENRKIRLLPCTISLALLIRKKTMKQ